MAEDILANAATTMSNGRVVVKYHDSDEMFIKDCENSSSVDFIITMPKKLASEDTRDILLGGIIHEGGHARFSPATSAIEYAAAGNNPEVINRYVNACIDAGLYNGQRRLTKTNKDYLDDGCARIANFGSTRHAETVGTIFGISALGSCKSHADARTVQYTIAFDGSLTRAEAESFTTFLNMFEDIRVERLMCQRFGNAQVFLDILNKKCIAEEWDKLKTFDATHKKDRCAMTYLIARGLDVDNTLDVSFLPQDIVTAAKNINEFSKTITEGNPMDKFIEFILLFKDPNHNPTTNKQHEDKRNEQQQKISDLNKLIAEKQAERKAINDKIYENASEYNNQTSTNIKNQGAKREIKPGTNADKQAKAELGYLHDRANDPNATQEDKDNYEKALRQYELDAKLGKELKDAQKRERGLTAQRNRISNNIAALEIIRNEITKEMNNATGNAVSFAPHANPAETGLKQLAKTGFTGEFKPIEPTKPKNFDIILEEFFQRKDLENEQHESGLLNRKRLTEICTDTCPEDERYTQEELRPTRTEILICVDTSSSMDSTIYTECGAKGKVRSGGDKHNTATIVTWELLEACKKAEGRHKDMTTRLFQFGTYTNEIQIPKSQEELHHKLKPHGGTNISNALRVLQGHMTNEKETIIVFVTDVQLNNNDVKTFINESSGTMSKIVIIPLDDSTTVISKGNFAKQLGVRPEDFIADSRTALTTAARVLERGIE